MVKRIHVSSSIANFRQKLLKRCKLPEWSFKTLWDSTIFFGAYHIGDWVRILIHQGEKKIFWCGSDILALQKSLWRYIIPLLHAKHFCENYIEERALQSMGIIAEVRPMIFDDLFQFKVTFKPSDKFHVWMCVQKDREDEYGLSKMERGPSFQFRQFEKNNIVFHVYGENTWKYLYPTPNIIFHGQVSEEKFNEEIKGYHASLRLNEFDGCSEVMAKSLCLGQYPISFIQYSHVDWAPDEESLIRCLRQLSQKKKANLEARNYWLFEFEKNLTFILS